MQQKLDCLCSPGLHCHVQRQAALPARFRGCLWRCFKEDTHRHRAASASSLEQWRAPALVSRCGQAGRKAEQQLAHEGIAQSGGGMQQRAPPTSLEMNCSTAGSKEHACERN